MKNKLTDLRDHLFCAIEGLLDPDKPLEIDRARAVADVAAKIIDSAKVENDYLRLTGGTGASGFIPHEPPPALPGQSRRIGRDG